MSQCGCEVTWITWVTAVVGLLRSLVTGHRSPGFQGHWGYRVSGVDGVIGAERSRIAGLLRSLGSLGCGVTQVVGSLGLQGHWGLGVTGGAGSLGLRGHWGLGSLGSRFTGV